MAQTTDDLKNYYANLLILQYIGDEKAYETIKSLVGPVIMDQLPTQVQDGFDIETAVGDQLDILGVYVGVIRYGSDFDGVAITLDDDDFRSLIKMAIARNNSGSSLYDIQNVLFYFFAGQIRAFDSKNMQMSYFMSSVAGSQDLAAMFLQQDLFPKPMGVALSSLIYLPSITGLFAYRTYTSPNLSASPFNTYADYQTTRPWLSYADTITI